MTASANRQARQIRSAVNVAANRITRDADTFNLVTACIRRRLLAREAELGRELMPTEAEAECMQVGLQDLVAFIRQPQGVACSK
ncbi:MAG: hypothetical protein MUF16_10175 [Burkholderiaceae bacterium]|jgi:hypothetical protein|nr:hypothetical protein [Burkholderiaceae bacterium]